MQLTLQYERRKGYLYVKASGEFTPVAAREAFLQVVQQANDAGLDRVLCDITLLQGLDREQQTLLTRYELGIFVADATPVGLKLAVLVTGQQLLEDRFDENVMVNRGARVKITDDAEEALRWLGIDSQ